MHTANDFLTSLIMRVMWVVGLGIGRLVGCKKLQGDEKWTSIVLEGVNIYVEYRVLRKGKKAETLSILH